MLTLYLSLSVFEGKLRPNLSCYFEAQITGNAFSVSIRLKKINPVEGEAENVFDVDFAYTMKNT